MLRPPSSTLHARGREKGGRFLQMRRWRIGEADLLLPLQDDDRPLLTEPHASTRQDALDERIGEYAPLGVRSWRRRRSSSSALPMRGTGQRPRASFRPSFSSVGVARRRGGHGDGGAARERGGRGLVHVRERKGIGYLRFHRERRDPSRHEETPRAEMQKERRLGRRDFGAEFSAPHDYGPTCHGGTQAASR